MKTATKFNPFIIIVHALCLFVLSYTLIIKGIFSSTDSLNTHLNQSGVYADASNLVKARISAGLEQRMQDRIVILAVSERLLDAIITPQLVEKQGQRILPLVSRVISQPLDIANNKVVVDMKSYKQRVTSELSSSTNPIPDILGPSVATLVAATPDQLTLVDMTQRPNSILGYLVKGKILFEHINTWNTIALTVGVVTAILLIIFNTENLRKLFRYLSIAYLVAGGIVFVGSYLFPYLLMLVNTGPNIYLNKLVSDAVYYLFAETRMPAIIFLAIGGVCYFLFRWSYSDVIQTQVNKIFHTAPPEKKEKTRFAA
jgi:hypothetical protein